MRLRIALLLAATTACTPALYVVPGSERDGAWESRCTGDGWWICRGSGPIRKVRPVDTFLGVSVRWAGDYAWQRYDVKHPERTDGAVVPYKETK